MKKEQVKQYVKDHKKQLIGLGIGIVGGGLGLVAFNKHYVNKDVVKMPGFKIEGSLTVGDLGKLGDEYLKHDPGLTKDTAVLEVGKLVFE